MKRSYLLIMSAAAALTMAGCSSNNEAETLAEIESSSAEVIEISTEEASSEIEETSSATGEETAEKKEETAETEAAPKPEDNFDVDSAAAADFAESIKAAVSDKDMEELAGLMGFPVYVGAAGGGVESREDFLSIESDRIFTDELVSSVLSADTGDLKPSKAGFVLSDGGSANIVFGVRDGELMITGINY